MSDKPISVGDLVMVVSRGRCTGSVKRIGYIFKVAEVGNGEGNICACGKYHLLDSAYANPENSNIWFPFHRLLRIDPPAISESERATNGEKEKV